MIEPRLGGGAEVFRLWPWQPPIKRPKEVTIRPG
jgi:hypothetical protein